MTPEQLSQLQKTISESIEKNVNGKINRLNDRLETYMTESADWREKADTKLELVGNIQGFGRVFMYIIGIIVACGTVVLTYTKIFNKE